MTLTTLATVADLEARSGLSFDPPVRAEALLDDASAMVRSYTGQDFTLVEDDVVVLPVARGRISLPQRPAQNPSAISAILLQSVALVTGGWQFDGIDCVYIGAPTWAINGPTIPCEFHTAQVTYSHGYSVIPGDVVAVVCQMVLRVLQSPAATPGLRSEQIDDYQYALGGGLTSGTIALVPEEKVTLNRYRRRSGSVVLRT